MLLQHLTAHFASDPTMRRRTPTIGTFDLRENNFASETDPSV
jgi:hypothetical protein